MRTAICLCVRKVSESLDGKPDPVTARPTALVIYASTHGHTRKIAERIGAELEEAGLEVTLHDVRAADGPPASGFDLVVAGASIHGGHYQAPMLAWAREQADALAERPSAFFSVCLAVADDTAESRAAAQG